MPRLLHHISARYPRWAKNAKYEYCCKTGHIILHQNNDLIMYNCSLSGRFSIPRDILDGFKLSADTQLGPKEPNFAATKFVTVLIFGIF